jgi:hypothetical protein
MHGVQSIWIGYAELLSCAIAFNPLLEVTAVDYMFLYKLRVEPDYGMGMQVVDSRATCCLGYMLKVHTTCLRGPDQESQAGTTGAQKPQLVR